jgi:hypothetical protein
MIATTSALKELKVVDSIQGLFYQLTMLRVARFMNLVTINETHIPHKVTPYIYNKVHFLKNTQFSEYRGKKRGNVEQPA